MTSGLVGLSCSSEGHVLELVKTAIKDDDIVSFRYLLASHTSGLSHHVFALLKDVLLYKRRDFFEMMSKFGLFEETILKNNGGSPDRWLPIPDAMRRHDIFRRISNSKFPIHEDKSDHCWFPLLDVIVNGDVEWIELLYNHKIFRVKTSGIPLIHYALKWGSLRGYESRKDPIKQFKNSELDIKILKTLINLGENINEIYENESPISYAARQKLWHCVEILLQNEAKIDCYCHGKTAREIIQFNKPELLVNIPEPDMKFKMLEAIKEGKENDFIKLLDDNRDLCNSENDHGYNLLQLTIERNLSTAVDKLLSCPEINPNLANISAKFNKSKLATRSSPPIVMAITSGQKDIFTALLYHKDINLCTNYTDNNTVYHFLARDWKYITNPSIKEISLTFLPDFFKSAFISGVNILQKNNKDKSALQLAVKSRSKDLLYYYFQYGAFADINLSDLQNIPPEFIQEYLDQCVKKNNRSGFHSQYVEINYSFIDASRIHSNEEEQVQMQADQSLSNSYNSVYIEEPLYSHDNKQKINSLSEMNLFQLFTLSPLHVNLLKHPVIRTFLYLKWKKIILIYFVNFLIFVSFAICLSLYLNDIEFNNTPISDKTLLHECIWFLTMTFWCIIVIRELLQMYISRIEYFQSIENYLEVTLLLLVIDVLYTGNPTREVASISIILSFVEITLLIGRNPYISTYVTIFIQVSKKSLSLLIIFFPSIFAFSYGFYIIFKDTKDNDTFKNLGYSVFKALIMLSGELDTNEIKFDVSSVLSRLLLVLFLVFIIIVFSNVLNALAISDTQSIIEEAELLNCIEEVRLYAKLEKVWLKYLKCNDTCICSDISKLFSTNVFPRTLYYGTGSHYRLYTQECYSFCNKVLNKYIFGLSCTEMGDKLNAIYNKRLIKNDSLLGFETKNVEIQNLLIDKMKCLELKMEESLNNVKSLTGEMQELRQLILSLKVGKENEIM